MVEREGKVAGAVVFREDADLVTTFQVAATDDGAAADALLAAAGGVRPLRLCERPRRRGAVARPRTSGRERRRPPARDAADALTFRAQAPGRSIGSAAKLWLTGINSTTLTFTCSGWKVTHSTAAAMSSGPSGVVPA